MIQTERYNMAWQPGKTLHMLIFQTMYYPVDVLACYTQEVTKMLGFLDGHEGGLYVAIIVWPVREAGQRQENLRTQHEPLYSWDIQYL